MIESTPIDVPSAVVAPVTDAAPRFSRAREWSKLIAITGIAQVAVQAIGFACGILVIRLLPVEEYALYTLANTMLGTMTLLADAGVATGVMSQGGKVWQDKTKLGAVLVTGMSLRRKFAVYSLAVAVPVLFYLLHRHGASWLMSSMLVLSLLPAFFSALSGSLLEIAPKLHQDIASLQKVQVSSNTIRLGMTGLTLFVFPFAAVAIVSSGIAQIFANWRLRIISKDYADRTQSEESEVRDEILTVVRRVLPGAIYHSLNGQVTIWLISFFGSTDAIAQVGALSRLAALIAILLTTIGVLIIPRFARLPANKRVLLSRFLQIEAGLVVIGTLMVGMVAAFPGEMLWILGKNYGTLQYEVVILAASSAIGLVASVAYSLGASRGLICPPKLLLPLLLLSQVLLIMTMNLGSVASVLIFSLIMNVVIAIGHFGYVLKKLL